MLDAASGQRYRATGMPLLSCLDVSFGHAHIWCRYLTTKHIGEVPGTLTMQFELKQQCILNLGLYIQSISCLQGGSVSDCSEPRIRTPLVAASLLPLQSLQPCLHSPKPPHDRIARQSPDPALARRILPLPVRLVLFNPCTGARSDLL